PAPLQVSTLSLHDALPISNVPRIFEEPSMPPYEMTLQRLFVSTTPDWPSVSKWYWELSKPHLEATSPEMTKTVQELTAGASSDLDRKSTRLNSSHVKISYA